VLLFAVFTFESFKSTTMATTPSPRPSSPQDPPTPLPPEEDKPPIPPLTKPLNIGDHCHVFCSAGNQYLAAVIVERRPSRLNHHNRHQQQPPIKRKRTVDVETLPPDDVDYYIHYVDHDRYVKNVILMMILDAMRFPDRVLSHAYRIG
jgi:RNA binding activity-knot of a chromodomain